MDITEQFNQVTEPLFEVQRFMDFYGVEVEDFQKDEPKGLLGDCKYVIKFSIPESWERVGNETRPELSHEDLRQAFKERFKDAARYAWKAQDTAFQDDELVEYGLSKFVFLCRMRSGETWSVQKREEKLRELEAKIEEARVKVQQETEYSEV